MRLSPSTRRRLRQDDRMTSPWVKGCSAGGGFPIPPVTHRRRPGTAVRGRGRSRVAARAGLWPGGGHAASGLNRTMRRSTATTAAHPERFAAIAQIGGRGDPERADRRRTGPARALRGADDRVVPPEEWRRPILASVYYHALVTGVGSPTNGSATASTSVESCTSIAGRPA
jgi:hypothetical protein